MIRCLIIDDEPIAIRVVVNHLGSVPDVEVVATCTHVAEALTVLRREKIDLVFLDIDMPEVTGIEFVESLVDPPALIFTTAHRDYALRGFELDAVDYLLKPIGFPRLNRAVEKYRRGRSVDDVPDAPKADPPALVHLQVDRRTVRVDPADIAYVESLSDYVIVHTDDAPLTSRLRLGDLEAQLAPFRFIRVHRSYLVPIRRVESFTTSNLQIGEATLPIGRTYRHRVMEALANHGARHSRSA